MKHNAVLVLLMLASLPALGQVAAVGPGTTGGAWPPYLAGGLIGVLVVFTLYFSQQAVGASSAYAKVAGVIGKTVAPRHIGRLPYFDAKTTRIDWEVFFVTGAVLGAFLAAYTGGEITGRWLPPMWVEHFGDGVWLRLLVAFAGGVIMAFGARLAGGCTSGHGISGALQLCVGSWVALICFFIGGVITATVIYRLLPGASL
jgi:uncharacterized membrane protein YedE/YeeE